MTLPSVVQSPPDRVAALIRLWIPKTYYSPQSQDKPVKRKIMPHAGNREILPVLEAQPGHLDANSVVNIQRRVSSFTTNVKLDILALSKKSCMNK